MNQKILTFLILGLILTIIFIQPVTADEGFRSKKDEHKPHGKEEAERITLTTGVITAEFEGKRPKVKFYYTADTENKTKFRVDFKKIIEYADLNGNGVFDGGDHKIKEFPLANVEWVHSNFYNITNNTNGEVIWLGINFTSEEVVTVGHYGGGEYIYPDVYVAFVVRIYQVNVTETITTQDEETTSYLVVGGAEIKIDVIVHNWPFESPDDPSDQLTLKVYIQKEIEGETTEPHTAEYERKQDQSCVWIIGNESGVVEGFFKWINKAVVTRPDGYNYTVEVKARYSIEAEVDEDEFEEQIKVYLCYPNFNGTLEHDPSVGVIETNAHKIFWIPPPTVTLPIVLLAAFGAFLVLVIAVALRPTRKN